MRYRVVDDRSDPLSPWLNNLENAIDLARTLRLYGESYHRTATVQGDNVDEGCASGLNRAESDRVWEALEDGLDASGQPYHAVDEPDRVRR